MGAGKGDVSFLFFKFLTVLGSIWKLIFTILFPIVLIPLLYIEDDDKIGDSEGKSTKFKAAYVIIITAVFWMVEAMPLAVTSLLPVVLLPLLGVQDTGDVTINYMKETNMMFVGGLIIALAVEYCNLHRRIALRVMTIIGSSPTLLMFGIMLTTMFLSMWMSNTACSAMMVPIVLAIIEELHGTPNEKHPNSVEREDNGMSEVSISQPSLAMESDVNNSKELVYKESAAEEAARNENARKMYMFAVAYSSNIGGTGVITGTGPNLVFQNVIKEVDVGQGGKYLDMTFATWFIFNVPAMLLNTFVAFVYLVFQFQGMPKLFRRNNNNLTPQEAAAKEREAGVAKLLRREYNKLGPMTFHEFGVLIVFVFTICLWLFRDPRFMPGWAEQIEDTDVGDSTAAMVGVTLLFIIPRDLKFLVGSKLEPLLDWKFVQAKLPWGVILLLGGGFAISDAADKSGLSEWIGHQLSSLENLPNPLILIIVMVLTAAVTEVCSNVATANVVLPILITLSKTLGIHPLYLTVPATVTCSFAFMLPVATPPNAIVFAAGNLKVMDMVKTGAFLNFSCVLVFFLVNLSYGELLFNYRGYEYPEVVNTTTFLLR